MSIVAEQFDHVVGIDTHTRTHTYCVVHSRTGAVVDSATFPTSAAGCQRALAWIRRRASTTVLAAVEGTSSYGAAITAVLAEADIDVAEVRPGARSTHAHAGKSDLLDAEAAARAVLGRDYATLARPRHQGDRVALRVLLASRSLIDQQRTANRNALTALLRNVELGVDARKPLSNAQIKTIASWRTTQADTATVIARAEARRLATSVVDQTRQLADNLNQLPVCTSHRTRHGERSVPARDDAPDLAFSGGGAASYLATQQLTGSEYGLFRWDMGEALGGPDAHFHRTMSEVFFVLNGVVLLFDGRAWVEAGPGDFLYVPAGGIHAFRNPDGAAWMLMLFAPGRRARSTSRSSRRSTTPGARR